MQRSEVHHEEVEEAVPDDVTGHNKNERETDGTDGDIPKESNTAIVPQKADSASTSQVTLLPNQPKDFKFPVSTFGNKRRSCQASWFQDFPWLHYDASKDAVFCYICKHQHKKGNLQLAKNLEQTFISLGFTNWKKAVERFQRHQRSECHKIATDFEVNIPKCHNIVDMTSDALKAERMQNRHCLIKIIETLQFLAGQGMPFRERRRLPPTSLSSCNFEGKTTKYWHNSSAAKGKSI